MNTRLSSQRNNAFQQTLIYEQSRGFTCYKSPPPLNLTKDQSTMNSIQQNTKLTDRVSSPLDKFYLNSERKHQRGGMVRRLQKYGSGDTKIITLSPTPKSRGNASPSMKEEFNSQRLKSFRFLQRHNSPRVIQPSLSRHNNYFPQSIQKSSYNQKLSSIQKPSLRFSPSDYRLAESCVTNVTNQIIRMQQSSIIQHTPLEHFTLLNIQSQNKYYKETLSIDKNLNYVVSIKIYNKDTFDLLNKQINIQNMLGKNNNILTNYIVSKNIDSLYILVRQSYKQTLKEVSRTITQQNIHIILKQLLTIFESLTNLKILYRGDIFENICNTNYLSNTPFNHIYKLKNFQQCYYRPQHSKRYFRVRYFRLIKQLIKFLLDIDNQSYSKKQKQYIHKQLKSFMKQLSVANNQYNDMRNHPFLINKKQ